MHALNACVRPAFAAALQDLPKESKRIEPTGLDDWMSYKTFQFKLESNQRERLVFRCQPFL